jgi:hypothetical protein
MTDCVALINSAPNFNVIFDYYTLYQWENGPASLPDLHVYPPDPADRFPTFEDLIYRMIVNAATRVLLVANHGHSDNPVNDDPVGLSVPLTGRNPEIIPNEAVLDLLISLIGKSPTDKDLTNIEKSNFFTVNPGTKWEKKLHLAPGTLKTLHGPLAVLRSRNIQRVDIRACNLGKGSTGRNLLNKLGRVLGAKVITAPDVHMFCGRFAVSQPASSTDYYNRWLAGHRVSTREFVDPGNASNRLAIQKTGSGAIAKFDVLATSRQVSWFPEKYVVPGTPGAGVWGDILLAGMDLPNHTYAVPAENDYVNHITTVNVTAASQSQQLPPTPNIFPPGMGPD